VNPRSTAQGTVRARLGNNAAAWRALTSAQRAGWSDLAATMNRTDSLGQTYNLTGFSAYCSVNNNNQAAGNAVVSDAPAIVTPGSLLTTTLTSTNAATSLAYTATPLAAGTRLFAYASGQKSAGRTYESDVRLLQVSAAAAASPLNLHAAYVAKWGTPITGQRIFWKLALYAGGFLGAPQTFSQVIA